MSEQTIIINGIDLKVLRQSVEQDGYTPSAATTLDMIGQITTLRSELEQTTAERNTACDHADRLLREASIHAQEARTANATIAEIYQVLTGATGEPGNWNGAEPARKVMAELERVRGEKDRMLPVFNAATVLVREWAKNEHDQYLEMVCASGDSDDYTESDLAELMLVEQVKKLNPSPTDPVQDNGGVG
jgi:hypothetical protein